MNKSSPHKPAAYFITGVSGVGKSATMAGLKALLSPAQFDIRDFDERGVPDGGGDVWHSKETKQWLDIAAENAQNGKSTIICGFNEPARIRAVLTDKHPHVTLILFNASPQTIRTRLRGRYPTKESEKEIERASGVSLEKFIENNSTYLPLMYKKFREEKCPVIETDDKTPKEVVEEIISYITTI